MKKLITLISAVLVAQLSLFTSLYAQVPQGFNYQAVARTSTGIAVTNQAIGLQLSIRQGSSTGTIVYTETHSVISNNIGLLNVTAGNGNPTFGSFSAINWGSGIYYMEISMDISGGTSYSLMGTQQLMSVPYALYAGNATTGATGPTGAAGSIGSTGATGNIGLTGTTGATGNNGPAGTTGATGNNGLAGNTGATGNNGLAGAVGATGNNGLAGTTGATGGTGIMGLTGSTGPTGSTGLVGTTGPTGSGGAPLNTDYNYGGAGAGRVITANAGPVTINASGTGAGAMGLLVTQSGTGTASIGASISGTGNAINAASTNAANTTSTIQATTNSSTLNNSALFGQTTGTARAITGQVEVTALSDVAVLGNNLRTTGGIGVEGFGYNGVSGQSAQEFGYGVFGSNTHTGSASADEAGVAGSGGYVGVEGESAGGTGYGVASLDNMISIGNFTCLGTKAFTIDHPLDPANKYLKHYTIESPEVLNMYRGNATCNPQGEAVITLPDYFSAVNINFSYHLTPIGAPAVLFIKQKVQDGKFTVAGGTPGMEFSWQLYAERNDVYVQQHPDSKAVEPMKSARDKGKYLKPELYGQPKDKAIFKATAPKR